MPDINTVSVTARETHRAWYLKNRERVLAKQRAYWADTRTQQAAKSRQRHLRRRYGLTPQRLNEIKEEQDFGCAICGAKDWDMKDGLRIDHDHVSGAVRGLLCAPCNLAIGLMKDAPSRLKAAEQYLVDHLWSVGRLEIKHG